MIVTIGRTCFLERNCLFHQTEN